MLGYFRVARVDAFCATLPVAVKITPRSTAQAVARHRIENTRLSIESRLDFVSAAPLELAAHHYVLDRVMSLRSSAREVGADCRRAGRLYSREQEATPSRAGLLTWMSALHRGLAARVAGLGRW